MHPRTFFLVSGHCQSAPSSAAACCALARARRVSNHSRVTAGRPATLRFSCAPTRERERNDVGRRRVSCCPLPGLFPRWWCGARAPLAYARCSGGSPTCSARAAPPRSRSSRCWCCSGTTCPPRACLPARCCCCTRYAQCPQHRAGCTGDAACRSALSRTATRCSLGRRATRASRPSPQWRGCVRLGGVAAAACLASAGARARACAQAGAKAAQRQEIRSTPPCDRQEAHERHTPVHLPAGLPASPPPFCPFATTSPAFAAWRNTNLGATACASSRAHLRGYAPPGGGGGCDRARARGCERRGACLAARSGSAHRRVCIFGAHTRLPPPSAPQAPCRRA